VPAYPKGPWVLTPEETEAFFLSLKVGLCCVLISLPPGVLIGWLLARREFRGKLLLDGLCHLPLVLPPVVTGYLLLILCGRRGLLGGFLEDTLGLTLAFNWKGAVLASAVVGFPLLLRAVRLAIEGVDPRLEQVARTLGAGRLRAFFTVTLRLALPGVLVGALLSFARSLGEFSAIFTYLNQPGGEVGAARLALVSIAIALGALVASEWVARRLKRG
jgi:molybdate transport system permease protein